MTFNRRLFLYFFSIFFLMLAIICFFQFQREKEFEILKLFLENKNRVFSRDEMLSRVWSDEVIVLDRTIDVNITRLRKKIGPYGKNIVTRLGYGYCFEE